MLTGQTPIPLVEVVWDDAESGNGWEVEIPETLKDRLCLTVGFLVKETENHILIASTISQDVKENLHFNCYLQIPMGMVKSLKKLC